MQHLRKHRVRHFISVVVGMQPYPGHPVILCAPAHILLPVGELRIDGSERRQQAVAMRAALRRQSCVDTTDVLVQNPIETSRPSLHDILLAQSRHQVRSFVARQAPKRPAREVDVRVDDHARYPFARKAGANSLRTFAPSTSSLAESGMSAPRTFASCEAKLRPPTSLPYTTRSGPSSRTAISTTPAVGSKPATSAQMFLAFRIMRMPRSQSPPV